jgi:hypothetical protein
MGKISGARNISDSLKKPSKRDVQLSFSGVDRAQSLDVASFLPKKDLPSGGSYAP